MTAEGPEHVQTRLILVRHGESKVTVDRVIGGPRSCSGLSELGIRQAERLRDRLAETGEITPTALIASAYPRARETAEIIAPAFGLEVEVVPGFGEHDPGPDCDGLTFREFVDRYGTPDWDGDPHGVTFPGGESVAEFGLRVGSTLSQSLRERRGGTLVVVCHGGVVDVIMRIALRTAPTGQFEIHTLNTSMTELLHVRPDRWRLLRYNDSAHLAGLPAETPRAGDE